MKLYFLLGIFVFFFCFTIAAPAQKTENELTLDDKRQIIESLLKEKFKRSPEKKIYISTANLPDEIQNDFPPIKNKKIQLVSAENSADSGTCVYEFGKFEVTGRFISISFGNCNEGLAYDFTKFGDTWKSVGLTIER